MKKIILLSLAGVVALTSCKKDEIEETNPINEQSVFTLIKKDTTSNDYVVSLFAKTSSIEVGYNNLYVSVKNLDGTNIENATVTFDPIMDMGTMSHGSPLIQPVYKSGSKMYEGVVIFTMPTGDMGTWTMSIDVNGGSTTFPIVVETSKPNTKYVGSYTGTDGEKYIVSIVKPFSWSVGMNDVSIMIHHRMMDSFIAVDDFHVVMDPQMMSMGHGSPNNISPTSDGNGYYSGEVNFTMTGDWRLNFDLIRNGDTIVTGAYIDIMF
ncbi:MAG: FixH family protein [Brumimicrobium sp.]